MKILCGLILTSLVLFNRCFAKKNELPKVDGAFTAWGEWGECSGTDVHVRRRNCTDPAPQGGGRDCRILGLGLEMKLCVTPGQSQDKPALSCQDILKQKSTAESGNYWLKIDDKVFQAYCDMETDGGGWTLVYSYTFTSYNNFAYGGNAVTPRPNWNSKGNVPTSTQVPISETDYNAMDFNMWKKLGNEFMVKSNINHWIACSDGAGSLVEWRAGAINCRSIKNVASHCYDNVPEKVAFYYYAPSLSVGNSPYYYFEDMTFTGNWPTHDPCGSNGLNHLTGIANPHGNIYIREKVE